MRILVTTDPHGHSGIKRAERWAKREEANAVIVTGDCWDIHFHRKLPFHFIRGNHEQEALWARYRQDAENVTRHEDYTTFVLGGRKFGVLGRMNKEAFDRMGAQGWFLGNPNNATFEEKPVEEAAKIFEGCDVLLFHDSPYPFLIKGEKAGSKYLTKVAELVQPKFVFHGHMHVEHDRMMGNVRVIGMEPCDFGADMRSYYLLDTEDLTVERRTGV